MERLASNVRNSLLLNATKKSRLRVWSIESLANLNNNNDKKKNSSSPSPTPANSDSGSIMQKKKKVFFNNKQINSNLIQADVAEILLSDIKLRLAHQYAKCLSLKDLLAQYNYDSSLRTSPTRQHHLQRAAAAVVRKETDSTTVNDPNDTKKTIIRAVNQPLAVLSSLYNKKSSGTGSSDNNNKDDKEKQKEKLEKLNKDIHNLEILQTDTYYLLHSLLLSNDKEKRSRVLTRFQTSDQQLITDTIQQIKARHVSSVESIADIAIGLRAQQLSSEMDTMSNPTIPGNHDECNNKKQSQVEIETFFQTFLYGKFMIQLLCDHYLGFVNTKRNSDHPQQQQQQQSKYGGISHVEYPNELQTILEAAISEAKGICSQNFDMAPEVEIEFLDERNFDSNENNIKKNKEERNLWIIRPWIHHVMVEMLKNAMDSTFQKVWMTTTGGEEQHQQNIPPIHIKCYEESDCFLIHIQDFGIGFSSSSCDNEEEEEKEQKDNAFLFASTTQSKRYDRIDNQQSYAMPQTVPLKGLGVGLPLSRVMMQLHGNGDLYFLPSSQNNNNEGKGGCTVVLKLIKDSTSLIQNG